MYGICKLIDKCLLGFMMPEKRDVGNGNKSVLPNLNFTMFAKVTSSMSGTRCGNTFCNVSVPAAIIAGIMRI